MKKVWLIAQMVKDDDYEKGYFLNEIVSVYANEASAEQQAKDLAAKVGGTYSIFEHEVRHSILM
jgi:hypothetical protein